MIGYGRPAASTCQAAEKKLDSGRNVVRMTPLREGDKA